MPSATVLFPIRLKEEADAMVRRRTKRKGDLVVLITQILESVDLSDVQAAGPMDVRDRPQTSVKLPKHLHSLLKKTAIARSVSMNALVNGAILKHFGQK